MKPPASPHLDRSFPGVWIQGDTLRIFLDDIDEFCENVKVGNLTAVKETSDVLQERFVELVSQYEQILDQHESELP